MELLLERKADPSATDKRGQTAADLCKVEALKELLLAAQAQRDDSTAGSEWAARREMRRISLQGVVLPSRPAAAAPGLLSLWCAARCWPAS